MTASHPGFRPNGREIFCSFWFCRFLAVSRPSAMCEKKKETHRDVYFRHFGAQFQLLLEILPFHAKKKSAKFLQNSARIVKFTGKTRGCWEISKEKLIFKSLSKKEDNLKIPQKILPVPLSLFIRNLKPAEAALKGKADLIPYEKGGVWQQITAPDP